MARRLERAALGAIMGVVAFVVERRLLKTLRKRGEPQAPDERSRLELAGPTEEVQDQG
jgi:hypothetical protein